MSDFREKSFDFANDTVKLLLTLNTGVLAFTLTFLKDFIGSGPVLLRSLLIWSWFILLFSIFCCLWALLAITGSAKDLAEDSNKKTSIYDKNISIPTGLAIISFLIGMGVMIVFTLNNFPASKSRKSVEVKKQDTVIVNIHSQIFPAAPIKYYKKPKKHPVSCHDSTRSVPRK